QEGIRYRTRAEQRRDHRIACESEQARGQRTDGYGEERTDHAVCITPSLAGAGAIVIGRCTLFKPTWGGFPRHRHCREQDGSMSSAKYDVLGIGNAIFDVLVQADEGFLINHGMIKGGMALIDEPRAAAIYRGMGP